MDKKTKDNEFLGEDIDDIFDSKFDKKKQQQHQAGHSVPSSNGHGSAKRPPADGDENILVLDDPLSSEDSSLNRSQPQENRPSSGMSSDAYGEDSLDMKDEFMMLEQEFDAIDESPQPSSERLDLDMDPEDKSDAEFVLDLDQPVSPPPIPQSPPPSTASGVSDPLDLDAEFVNMKPPESAAEKSDDFGDFELERHAYSSDTGSAADQAGAETPPPIPQEGGEFVLDSSFDNNATPDSPVTSSSTYSMGLEHSIDQNTGTKDIYTEEEKKEVRFFDAQGNPVSDEDILKPSTPKVKKKQKNGEGPPPSVERAKQRMEEGHRSPMMDVKPSSPMSGKRNLIIGAVIVLLVVAGIFIVPSFLGDSKKSEEKKVTAPVSKKSTVIKKVKPRKRKKKKVSVDEKVNKLFKQAQHHFQSGDLEKAKEVCAEAMALKKTDALVYLEGQINDKIESIAKQQAIEAKRKQDQDDYDRAIRIDTIAAFENYLKKHPEGEFVGSAKSMINKITKRNYQNRLKEIIEKANQYRKIRLRSKNGEINQAITRRISSKGRIINQFEIQTIEGDKILIDYATGLMWMVAKYRMAFEKARFWAVRHYGGYYNWRLPTAEEVYSLKGVSPSNIFRQSIQGVVIWTGDGDFDSANYWVFSLTKGSFTTGNVYDSYNLIAVRTIE